MSLTAGVLSGLVLGLAFGIVLRAAGQPELATWIEPVGTIWVNAIRMTIIPLVLSLLVTGVAAAGDVRRIGRLGARTIGLFILLLGVTAVVVALLAPLLYTGLHIDAAATADLRANAAPIPSVIGAGESAREFLLGIVPVNPVQAAADGAMLSVIVFALLFGFALTRVAPPERDVVLHFFQGIRDATFVLIGWILAVAPIGIFALSLALGSRLGGVAFGAVGYYLGLVILLHAIGGVALYLFASWAGGIPLGRFARGVAPAQAVAFSTRSSYASLPALLECAERRLGLPADVSGFVLPLAVATFKLTSPIYWTLGAMLVARLYGVELGPAQIGTIAAASVLLNAATPGIPSGGLLIQAPVYMAVGLPVEGIGLLIAIDAIPDMFKTAFNVTADMAVAAIVARSMGAAPAAVPPAAAVHGGAA